MTRERGGKATETDGPGHDLAPLAGRFTALFIDWVSCLLLFYLLSWTGLWPTPDPFTSNLLIASLFIVYYTACLTFRDQSLGMAIMRIACVRADTGGRLGLWRALVRSVLLSLVLPALTALGNRYGLGLHDVAAGSVMLKADA
ncbi:RDD family protein [Glycomyces salinus]|uniref:RDD family protein n=1 Tax=Glycomyces salinus TaxID=980294 RepID=UPI0018ED3D60|nr:RDD family protein [Glycomyces salinus]